MCVAIIFLRCDKFCGKIIDTTPGPLNTFSYTRRAHAMACERKQRVVYIYTSTIENYSHAIIAIPRGKNYTCIAISLTTSASEMHLLMSWYFSLYVAVEDMIKEVDVDGDGRIDFYGKRKPGKSSFSPYNSGVAQDT